MRWSVLYIVCCWIWGGVLAVAGEQVAFKNFEDNAIPSYLVKGVGGFRVQGQQDYTLVKNTAPAQEFVPSVSGKLGYISAFVHPIHNVIYTDPLIVEIRSETSGLPSDLLGSVVLNPEMFSRSYPVEKSTFHFGSQDIDLTANQHYFVVFRSERPGIFNTMYHVRTFDPNPLSLGITPIFSGTGGTAPWFDSTRPQEIGLEVVVVPEPAAVILVLLLTSPWLIGRPKSATMALARQ
jgi:hypothetical protein